MLQRMRRFPRQRPACLGLHLDTGEQIRDRLPSEQFRRAAPVVGLRERECGVEGRAHDPHAHGADKNSGEVECT